MSGPDGVHYREIEFGDLLKGRFYREKTDRTIGSLRVDYRDQPRVWRRDGQVDDQVRRLVHGS